MKEKLWQICRTFCVEGMLHSYEEITVGNVNRTYKVNVIQSDGEQTAYMVQALNTVAFPEPVAVMENISRVTEHIRGKKPGCVTLKFYRTGEHKPYFFEGKVLWRVFNYISSSTYNNCDDLDIVRSAGAAFGEFQRMLADFDPEQLHITISDFHNTRHRYRQLEAAAAADPVGRLAEVQEELGWLWYVQEWACELQDLFESGKLPLRVTHNDTKINNVLFAPEEKQALAVIDLDTVMPGLVGFDFGDAIRFAANCVAEDCPQAEKAGVDMTVFRAFTEGFLGQTVDILSDAEVDTLALSCFALTCEQAVRFLTDYILGDPYYKTACPEHNLLRARCQIALAKDMLHRHSEMEKIVRECMRGYYAAR